MTLSGMLQCSTLIRAIDYDSKLHTTMARSRTYILEYDAQLGKTSSTKWKDYPILPMTGPGSRPGLMGGLKEVD
jgi:hypothetical protein